MNKLVLVRFNYVYSALILNKLGLGRFRHVYCALILKQTSLSPIQTSLLCI